MSQTSTNDSEDLARFGYEQELNRTLGSFSSFASGFSYVSIFSGVFSLFAFGFGFGGPAFWWTIPMIVVGQLLVSLLFAELSSQYPLAGGVAQWAKRISHPAVGWTAGWILVVASGVAVAGPAVGLQIVLPQIWSGFEVFGSADDIGTYSTVNGARNAVLLGVVLIVAATIINIAGVRIMAVINNVGVLVELVGCAILIIVLFAHAKRGPDVVFHTDGAYPTSSGYVGALLIATLFAVNIFYGFDTAGTLAEETSNPRKSAPRGIIRALLAAGIMGALLVLAAQMAMPNIFGTSNLKAIADQGLPYMLKTTLGYSLARVFLVCVAIAVCVCCLATEAAAIRFVFSMARDGKLPFSKQLSKVNKKTSSMIFPSLIMGIVPAVLLVLNLGNRQVFTTVTAVSAVMAYLAYLILTSSLLIKRIKRQWPRTNHGPYFNLGKFGLPVNILAVAFQTVVIVNLAWPRAEIYGDTQWYFKWGALVLPGAVLLVGGIYYLLGQLGERGTPAAERPTVLTIEPEAGA